MTRDRTAQDVAMWMQNKLLREGSLYQRDIVDEIAGRFGREFIYENERGRLAISKSVLDAFRRLSGDDIVWCRRERYWRPREEWDLPGRMQP